MTGLVRSLRTRWNVWRLEREADRLEVRLAVMLGGCEVCGEPRRARVDGGQVGMVCLNGHPA